jgi:5-methylcytosine-specific restriction endonuclease McrA
VTDPEYMRRYYRMRMDRAITYLGGACAQCGSDDDLEIDHIDPATKSFDFGKVGWKKPWAEQEAELQKCQLLCSQHHRVKTRHDLGVPHGGGASGKRNCPCAPCRARKAEYMTRYATPR